MAKTLKKRSFIYAEKLLDNSMRYVNIADILSKEKVEYVIGILEEKSLQSRDARFFLESLKKGETVFDTEDVMHLFAITNVLES